MPRIPLHALTWSRDLGLYELSTRGQFVRCFRPGDQQAWQSWLREVTSLAFHSPFGSLNVYQEARPHGGQYWYAYHTDRGGTRKHYLGRTARVSLARLEETAQALSNENENTHSSAPPSFLQLSSEAEQGVTLLSTKLSPPRLPSSLVPRDRLLATLDGVFSTSLTLLAASAGWGKTTLLATWASRHPHQVAWLSLDSMDNDPFRFWAAVIAALRTCVPGIGAVALAMVHSPQPPPFSTILTVLLNELAEVGEQRASILLLLDDYQVIEDQAIHETVTFWVEHLPAHVHLLLSSRVAPDLPLPRLRLRGQLAEIRTADVRFRPDEVSLFLRQAMGLSLSEEEVAALERRTEGWVAGLQLAALSIRKQEDRSAWIATFTGSHRSVLDYVRQEILMLQPLPIQHFLLHVAVLTRMNAALCQAVTGELASQDILENLERSNLFVVSLDEQRQWYRLHDLFREALLARLSATQPELLPQLYQQAARWYEAQGEAREAIEYALAGSDYSFAAHLLEREASHLWLSGEDRTMPTWILALPDAVLCAHARLALNTALRSLESVHVAVEASYTRTRVQVERTLLRLEGVLHSQEGATLAEAEVAVIQRRIRLLRAFIATRAIIAHGDRERLRLLAQETERLSEDEEISWNMIALSITFWLILAFQHEGALLVLRLLEVKQRAIQAGDHLAVIRVMEWLARAYIHAGQLHQVERECLEGLALVEQIGGRTLWEGYLYAFLADAYYAWNRLEEASGMLHQTLRIGHDWQQLDLLITSEIRLAQVELARGDLTAADQALQKAEASMQQMQLATHTFWVVAARVQYWLAEGDLTLAADWAARTVFHPQAWDPNHSVGVLMLVQVYLAQQQYSQAVETLERFSTHLDRPGDIDTAIKFLALHVVALHQAGKREQAARVAAHLLAMTEPEGYIRVYLDQGEPMKQVLLTLLALAHEQSEQAHHILTPFLSFVAQLVAAFEQEEKSTNTPFLEEPAPSQSRTLAQKPSAVSPALVAPLTRREQEVLHLLADGASNQEIANALVIQLSTVKKHVSKLLGKLGAASRTQAIAQARAVSLL